jgi:hypothetical protein
MKVGLEEKFEEINSKILTNFYYPSERHLLSSPKFQRRLLEVIVVIWERPGVQAVATQADRSIGRRGGFRGEFGVTEFGGIRGIRCQRPQLPNSPADFPGHEPSQNFISFAFNSLQIFFSTTPFAPILIWPQKGLRARPPTRHFL